MKRREFITLLGGAAGRWPIVARGEQAGRTYKLAFLVPVSRDSPAIAAFFDELHLNGFIEGPKSECHTGRVRSPQRAECGGGDGVGQVSPRRDPQRRRCGYQGSTASDFGRDPYLA